MHCRPAPLAALVAALAVVPAAGSSAPPGGPAAGPIEAARAIDPESPWIRSVTFLSPVYTVDRLYRSMMGPQSTQEIRLEEPAPGDPPELLWIVGYTAEVVGPDGASPMGQEFMCHSNLDIDMPRHEELFGLSNKASPRLFTLSQGQQEIRFPEGFGIPVRSDEALRLTTQVLNHNVPDRVLDLRHRVSVRYIRDAEAPGPVKPLYQVSANGLVLVEGRDGYFNVPEPDPGVHGEGCLVGGSADPAGRFYTDEQGRKFTGHWIVEPGVQVNRTNTTRFMSLRFDTTIHYVAVHLHPFAESLELVDLTAGESVFLSHVTPSSGKIGIDRIEHYSSRWGIPVFEDHEYELVSVYNNSSGVNQDSMAVMYMYALDRDFDREKFLAGDTGGHEETPEGDPPPDAGGS